MSDSPLTERDKPKRKGWQFHLSTALLLMIALGGFMYLELTPYVIYEVNSRAGGTKPVIWSESEVSYGWPVSAVTKFSYHINQEMYKEVWGTELLWADNMGETPLILARDTSSWHTRDLLTNGFADVLTVLVVLYLLARIWEFALFREGRKP